MLNAKKRALTRRNLVVRRYLPPKLITVIQITQNDKEGPEFINCPFLVGTLLFNDYKISSRSAKGFGVVHLLGLSDADDLIPIRSEWVTTLSAPPIRGKLCV